jgi:nucleotide-binding universal stress UspA family protein
MTAKIKKIMVPIDFSDCSQEALQYAGSLAQLFGAEVMLLHVIESPVYGVDLTLMQPGETSDLRRKLSEMIEHAVDQMKAIGVTAEGRFVTGFPSVEIIKAVKEHGADLVVIGTHGRTGLAHILLGSTAERVIQRASCPVVTVKSAKAPKEKGAISEEEIRAIKQEVPSVKGMTFCHLCAQPSDEVICETCKIRVQAEALERKKRVEKEGRVETGRR